MANQYRSITPKGIESIFRVLIAADPRIERFRLGDYASSETQEDVYPLVLLDFLGSRIERKATLQYNRWDIRLECYGMRRSDGANTTDVFSETHVIMNDLILRFIREQDLIDMGFIFDNNISRIDYIVRNDRDDLIGVRVDLTFLTPLMQCADDFPVDALPDLGLYYSAATLSAGSQYLTCATLTGCTVIQTIQQNIEELYTLTGGTSGNLSGDYLPTSGGTGGPYVFTGQTLVDGIALGSGGLRLDYLLPNGVAYLDQTGTVQTDPAQFVYDQPSGTLIVNVVSGTSIYSGTSSLGDLLDKKLNRIQDLDDHDAIGLDFHYFPVFDTGEQRAEKVVGADLKNWIASSVGQTYVQPGTNITTGGTPSAPIVSVVSSPVFSSITATTYFSGSTPLSTVFSNSITAGANLFKSGNEIRLEDEIVLVGVTATRDSVLSAIVGNNTGNGYGVQGIGATQPGVFSYSYSGVAFYANTDSLTEDLGVFYNQWLSGLRILNDGGLLWNSPTGAETTRINLGVPFVQPGTNITTGGTVSATTINVVPSPVFTSVSATSISATTYFSGSTPLNTILSSLGGSSPTYVQPGTNITTGGTASAPVVNVSLTPVFTTVSATTFVENGVSLASKYAPISVVPTYVQPGTNITTGGTASAPTINVSSTPVFTSVSATTISATTLVENGTSLASKYAALSHTHTSSQISDSTAAGRAILTASTASDQRTALGLGTAAVLNEISVSDTSGQATSSTSYVDMTGISASMEANTLYAVELLVMAEVSSTSGSVNISLNGSTAASYVTMHFAGLQAAGNINIQNINTYDWTTNMPTGVAAANSVYLCRISALILNGGSTSTLSGRIRRGGTTGTVTVRGAYMKVRRL